MNKALIIIKSPGIGDLQILLSYVHQLSKEIDKLKNRADSSHNKIQNVAKDSQEIHLQIIGFSKQINELKKKEINVFFYSILQKLIIECVSTKYTTPTPVRRLFELRRFI